MVPNSSVARVRIDVGTVIAGTYTIEALVGRGGMGAVFLASHNRLPGKKVAIKVLHAEFVEDDVLARFRREADIAAQLDHPNIVGVVDYNMLPDGTPYLVMEYLQGQTLAQRIHQGPLTLEHVSSVVRQVGSALAAAHKAGIVHRDLKPQNIFLVPTTVDGRRVEIAKVLDFGISKIRGSQTVKTQESTLLGTPQYMAPEQATGKHDSVDERTDVFALGAIVYEMLSGNPAFSGETIPEVVFKVVYEEPTPLQTAAPQVPLAVVDAVKTAMKKPAIDRFPSVNGFVEALTGQPLAADLRLPTLNAPDVVGVGSGKLDPNEAFARTMGSGDYGGAVAPAPSTAPGSQGARDRSAVSSDGATLSMPPQQVSSSARNEPFVPTVQSAAKPSMTVRGQLAPDGVVAKKKTGGFMIVGGVLVVIAGAAMMLFVVLPKTDRAGDTIAQSNSTTERASVSSAAPPPTSVESAGGGGGGTMHAGSGSSAVVERPAQVAQADTSLHDDDKGTKPGNVPPDQKAVTAALKRPHAPSPQLEPKSMSKTDTAVDPEIGTQLAQAESELAAGNFDMAWRLANTVINTAKGAARQQALGIHGVIECTRNNNAEGATIDLRRLGGRGPARERILKACHARDLLGEER